MQRTLTVRGRITVRLVSSLTTLDLTNEENMLLFVCSEAVGSERVKLETSHTVKSTFHPSETYLIPLSISYHTLFTASFTFSLSLSLSLSLSPVSTLNSLSLSFFLFNVSVDDNCLKGFQVIQAVDKRTNEAIRTPIEPQTTFYFCFNYFWDSLFIIILFC